VPTKAVVLSVLWPLLQCAKCTLRGVFLCLIIHSFVSLAVGVRMYLAVALYGTPTHLNEFWTAKVR
jgi:hypothetical protein